MRNPSYTRSVLRRNAFFWGRSELHSSSSCYCVGGTRNNKPIPLLFTRDNVEQIRQSLLKKIYHYMAVYEEFIGIKQVKEAHARVLLAEEKFVRAQDNRRKAQDELMVMQVKLKALREELERTPRGNEKYIELVTKEWNLNREEDQFRKQFEQHEDRERETFNELSSALRFSHEKERAQNEKTKYWSVFGSLVGACVGIIGTSINSSLKIRQLKNVMTETSAETMTKVEARLAALFSQLDKLGDGISTSELSSPDFANKILASMENVIQKVDNFSERLERVELSSTSDLKSGLKSVMHVGEVEFLIVEQETRFKKQVVIGTAAILIFVPLLSKLLFNF